MKPAQSATPGRYTRPAVALHRLMALGIFGTFALGLTMHELALSPTKLRLYSWHKWAGVTLFLLAFARVAWRPSSSRPAFWWAPSEDGFDGAPYTPPSLQPIDSTVQRQA